MHKPCNIIRRNVSPDKIPSDACLGFSSNKLASCGSTPMAIAGRESVSRLINSKCTGANGTGSPKRDVYNTDKIPAMLPESKNKIAFFILR